MRNFVNIVICGLLVFVGIACNQKPDAQASGAQDSETPVANVVEENAPMITAQGVGTFQLGQPIHTEINDYNIERQEVVRETEEGPTNETLYVISDENEALLALQPAAQNASAIGEIRILSDRYQTSENIGVGATIADFIKAYPDYKLWYTYVSDRYILETPRYPSVQFLLHKADYKGGKINITSEITPLQVSDFESDANIKMVRIF